jgi:twitching motility protein PilT
MVIAQHLLPGPNPADRRALAIERMIVNLPVRSAIGQGKIESIDSAIQTGVADGMIRMDDSLAALLHAKRISFETAKRYARHPDRIA